MRSDNKPRTRLLAFPNRHLQWLWFRCWYCYGWQEKSGERGERSVEKIERNEQKIRGKGKDMNPTFQMRTAIKLIAWQGESRITVLHRQTYTVISRVLCLFLFGEAMSPGKGSLFNLSHHSLLDNSHCSCRVMSKQKLPRDSKRPTKQQLVYCFFLSF